MLSGQTIIFFCHSKLSGLSWALYQWFPLSQAHKLLQGQLYHPAHNGVS